MIHLGPENNENCAASILYCGNLHFFSLRDYSFIQSILPSVQIPRSGALETSLKSLVRTAVVLNTEKGLLFFFFFFFFFF